MRKIILRNLGLYRLKGIACVAVFSRHILDAFLWNQTLNNPSFDYFFNLPIVWNICSSGGGIRMHFLLNKWIFSCMYSDR